MNNRNQSKIRNARRKIDELREENKRYAKQNAKGLTDDETYTILKKENLLQITDLEDEIKDR
jgi:hypothetical protein